MLAAQTVPGIATKALADGRLVRTSCGDLPFVQIRKEEQKVVVEGNKNECVSREPVI